MQELTLKVIQGLRHSCYDRTVELQKFYQQVADGIGQGELVLNLRTRENDEAKQQRLRITQNRTKATFGKIESFLKRVYRADKMTLEVKAENEQSNERLNAFVSSFSDTGGTALQYVEDMALFLAGKDPNAAFWVKHSVVNGADIFDPVIFSSSDVLYYEKKHGSVVRCVLQAFEPVQYLDAAKDQVSTATVRLLYTFEANKLYLTVELNEKVLKFTDYYQMLGENPTTAKVKDKNYLTFEYELTSNVPVMIGGGKKDRQTMGKSFVSYWDNATEQYRQLINVGSMYDISLILHTFPQRIQYYTPCNFQDVETGSICRDGKMHPQNTACPACDGSGKKVHISGQSTLELALPDEGENVRILPKDLVAYVSMPLDVVLHQANEVGEYPKQICESVYGVDLTTKPNGIQTATANQNYYDTAYDVMYEFTSFPVQMFYFTVDKIAESLGIENYTRKLVYTNNFNLESETDLFILREQAVKAGATPESLESIDKRILSKQNKNNSKMMAFANSMRKFLPFSSIDKELKYSIVTMLPNRSKQKALFLNFNQIMHDIVNSRPDFVLLSYEQQKQIVDDATLPYIDLAVSDESIISAVNRSDILNNEA